MLFLLGAAVPLHGQEDLAPGRPGTHARQAGSTKQKYYGVNWRSDLQTIQPLTATWESPLAQQGQFEAAAAEYRKSLTLCPKQPEVAFDLGWPSLSKDIPPRQSRCSKPWSS